MLEARIDELYKGSLGDFVERRSALAKSLGSSDAKRVRELRKPSAVPWAVNQVYWRDRGAYDRVKKSGEKLRKAQLAALKSGAKATKARASEVRTATDAHRRALADAVASASKLATAAGEHPSADGLMRTFEALSLAAETPEPPGRLTRPLQPAGFEALAGVSLPAQATRPTDTSRAAEPAHDLATRRREREYAAAERRRNKAIERAEVSVDRARAAEGRAREAWERARGDLEEAEANLRRSRSQHS